MKTQIEIEELKKFMLDKTSLTDNSLITYNEHDRTFTLDCKLNMTICEHDLEQMYSSHKMRLEYLKSTRTSPDNS